jgi:hypothetical protein
MHEVSRRPSPLARPLRRVLSLQLLALVAVTAQACERDSRLESAAEPSPGAPVPVAETDSLDAGSRRDATVLTIFSAIREDSLTRGRDITVAATDTTLVVKGRVAREPSRRRVLEIVRRHLGRFTLVDSLVVDPAAPEPGATEGP